MDSLPFEVVSHIYLQDTYYGYSAQLFHIYNIHKDHVQIYVLL